MIHFSVSNEEFCKLSGDPLEVRKSQCHVFLVFLGDLTQAEPPLKKLLLMFRLT